MTSRWQGKRQLIADYCNRVFAECGMPHGAQRRVAEIFDVSPGLVGEVAQTIGIRKYRLPRKGRAGCHICGEDKESWNPFYCTEHRLVPLICAACDKEFAIRPSALRSRLKQMVAKGNGWEGRLYCSHACSGRNLGNSRKQDHCIRGHDLSAEDAVRVRADGRRDCLVCNQFHNERRRARRRFLRDTRSAPTATVE